MNESEYAGTSQESVDSFVRHDRLIRQGLCPNGCGLMQQTEALQTCGTCGFFTNAQPQVTRQ